MKRLIAALLLLAPSFLMAQISPPSTPQSLPSTAVTAQQPTTLFSNTCFNQGNCVTIKADTQTVNDASSTSTTTVTCPNNDCNFTAADVGKIVWATTQGSAAYLNTTFVCPQTTISAVNGAQSITLASTCTASGTGNVVLWWGHDDGPTIQAAYNTVGCSVMKLATNKTAIMISVPFGSDSNWNSACSSYLTNTLGAPRASLVGEGYAGSQATIVLTPNFSWSSCAGGTDSGSRTYCIGSKLRAITNIQVTGTGLTPATNSNCANATNKVVLGNAGSGNMTGVDLGGICPGESGLGGIEVAGSDNTMDEGGAQDVGQYACIFGGPGTQMSGRGNDCQNQDAGSSAQGVLVTGGATVYAYSSVPFNQVLVNGNSTMVGIQNNYSSSNSSVAAVEVTSGSFFYSYGETIAGLTAVGLKVDSGGYAYMNGTTHSGSPNAVNNAGTLVTTASTYNASLMTNSGTIISGGSNKLNSIPTTTGSGSWSGVNVLFGSCQGTATSSSTLGLYGFGQFSTPACTSTTVNQGIPVQVVPLSGSTLMLVATATHAGVNASSGVVTVMKAHGSGTPSATALTCTIGTGTSCIDNAHFDVPAVGDVYSCQFTTQGSEVLAGVTCSVLVW